ncbi:MAG: ATP phosphoribosyltransferase [Erysipelotrichaceae bacterium]|jgi:ATP phosphoribosyltransferase|nr:ATP phosphoribosyltransferase [Bacillota bacterium]
MLNIALTKGRLEKQTMELLKQVDYGVEVLENKGRQLVVQDSKKPCSYFLVKSNDCITYVSRGVADVGVVGKDVILESNNDFYEVLDLGLGKCKFVVASLPEKNPYTKVGHVVIGTKYPKVAKTYFTSKGIDVEIVKIDGSVELGPILGLCDAIVDIMETGNTLKENGLIVFDEIVDISARLIVNKASFKLKRDEIKALLDDLNKVV